MFGDSDFFLLAVAVVAIGIYLIFPPRYRAWCVLAFLVVILFIFLVQLPFKLVLFILVASLFFAARVLVGKRM